MMHTLCVASHIGWRPAADRSMIDSRRCASPTPSSGKYRESASSGPRWRMTALMRSNSDGSSVPEKPAIPHMSPGVASRRLLGRGVGWLAHRNILSARDVDSLTPLPTRLDGAAYGPLYAGDEHGDWHGYKRNHVGEESFPVSPLI